MFPEGSQSRHLEGEAESDAMELLTGLPHGFFSLLSNTTHDYQPRGGTTHSGVAPPKSINNQENEQVTWIQVNMMEAIPQLILRTGEVGLEMDQRLRTLVVLPEDLGSILNNHKGGAQPFVKSSSEDLMSSSGLLWHQSYIGGVQNIHVSKTSIHVR